jgi:NarL family two-component system response regulator LiaR
VLHAVAVPCCDQNPYGFSNTRKRMEYQRASVFVASVRLPHQNASRRTRVMIPTPSLTLLVVHPSPVFRLGIVAMLEGSNIHVIGHASSGTEAVKMAIQHQPAVVLLSDQLEDGDVFDHAKCIRDAVPSAKVLMLGSLPDPTSMARAAAIGIADFIFDIKSTEDLKAAINAAAAGEFSAGSSDYREIIYSLKDRSLSSNINLTPREQQVLRHIAYGLSNDEIAQSMQISVETVKEFVSGVLRKLRVKDRTQAAVWAVRNGVV